ncbi:MAG: transporter substrate-binding domain-containing protein [Desulfobacter sp.]|nr:transporter substrate-binding domain-containing protein [Desulfobacter sp.]WDP84702.1 MAG: transporter substrate-binding domain-containing protein [Desulfobacter sp.]
MDWPPFDFALGGLPAGYSIDLLNLIAGQTGLGLEYVNGYSWDALETMFRAGELDLLHSLFKTPEREAIAPFTRAYAKTTHIFVTKAGKKSLTQLTQLHGKTISLPRSWATNHEIKRNHPQITILEVNTPLEAMNAVKNEKADATIEIKQVALYLKNAYFMDTLVLGNPVPELSNKNTDHLYFQVHPAKPLLKSILEKGLKAITPAQKLKIASQWGLVPDTQSKPGRRSGHVVPHKALLDMAKTGKSNIQSIMVDGKSHLAFTHPLIHFSNQSIGVLVNKTEVLNPYLKKVRLALFATLGCLVFFTPLLWFVASVIVRPIKALVIENQKVKERRWDEIQGVSSNIKEIMTLSNSTISMASAIMDY